MLKDDDEDDNLEAALDVAAAHIKETVFCVGVQSSDSTNTSNEIAEGSAPDALQKLHSKIGEQYLPSLLIGNSITSLNIYPLSPRWNHYHITKKHSIPLQVRLGVYLNKQKTVKRMHDYLIYCSYDECSGEILCHR